MSKIVTPLAEVQIKNESQSQSYKLADWGGLFLEVPHGRQVLAFQVSHWRGRKADRLRALSGQFLGPGATNEGRARALIAQGIDPAHIRKEEKQAVVEKAQDDARTFEVVAREGIRKQAKAWSEDHAERVQCRLEKHLFPCTVMFVT